MMLRSLLSWVRTACYGRGEITSTTECIKIKGRTQRCRIAQPNGHNLARLHINNRGRSAVLPRRTDSLKESQSHCLPMHKMSAGRKYFFPLAVGQKTETEREIEREKCARSPIKSRNSPTLEVYPTPNVVPLYAPQDTGLLYMASDQFQETYFIMGLTPFFFFKSLIA